MFRSAGSLSLCIDSGTKVPSLLWLPYGLVIICIQPGEQRMEEEWLFTKKAPVQKWQSLLFIR